MRVISGKARGKKLDSLEGEDTRPTLDRIKESLFNIIQFKIQDSIVLDLFSGSGSLGIECLSRGAKEVVFCDNSNLAIKIINQNIENTKFKEQSVIINKDYMLALKKMAKESKKFNLIFLDPPYKSDFVIKAIEQIIELDLLSKDGTIVIETDDKNISAEISSKYPQSLLLKKGKENGCVIGEQILKSKDIEVLDTRKYGRVMLMFIGRRL